MINGVPTAWLSADRVAHVSAGAVVAAGLVQAVFPPRADDETGTLAVSTVEMLSNRALRGALADVERTGTQRRWWLEGFIAGYCAQAAAALSRAGDELDIDEARQLDDMRTAISCTLTPELLDASDRVFAFTHAVLTEDELGAAWAMENLFSMDAGASMADHAERVRHITTAAMLTCCASWQVLLLGYAST